MARSRRELELGLSAELQPAPGMYATPPSGTSPADVPGRNSASCSGDLVYPVAQRPDEDGRAPDYGLVLRRAPGASIAVERDPTKLKELTDGMLPALQRRAARALAVLDRLPEAASELERVLPRVLAGSGPRWLGAMSNLDFAATAVGNASAEASIYDAIGPYRGRLVVFSGATHVGGPVSALPRRPGARLGRYDEAVVHVGEAVAVEEQLGALPMSPIALPALPRTGGSPRQR